MNKWDATKIKQKAAHAYHKIGGSESARRQDAMVHFAKRHKLTYFKKVTGRDNTLPPIAGVQDFKNQSDTNIAIGSHDGYDVVLFEREAIVEANNYAPTPHHWYVLEVDLIRTKKSPYMFIGTRQLPKALYANVLKNHPETMHMPVAAEGRHSAVFHSSYAVIASPLDSVPVHRIVNQAVVELMASQRFPFAVELQNDSLVLFTDTKKPNEQLLHKLLHFGLWFAKQVDERSY